MTGSLPLPFVPPVPPAGTPRILPEAAPMPAAPARPAAPRGSPGERSASREGGPAALGRSELWLGVHLPDLALECQKRAMPPAHALAVISPGRSPHIAAADPAARRAGVRAGMSLAAALAVLPQLVTQPRNPARERALLERLAVFAQRFTPRVSLEPPDGLLLEVGGSLGLFGGFEPLHRAFRAGCLRIGVRPDLALAPVPLAALAGARAGAAFSVLDEALLLSALRPLPLRVLRWPPEAIERLARVGVRSVGEALRLPRSGFARRFGAEQLAALDRLTGRGADPRRAFRAPERFRIRRSFIHERQHHDALLKAIAPLVEALGRFLQTRQYAVTAISCRLLHRHVPPTPCVLRLAQPEAAAGPLVEWLGERLAGLVLPEPVCGCELATAELVPHVPASASLWRPGEYGGSGMRSSPLIERLRARLGMAAVHGLQCLDSHVPEEACRRADPQALEALQAHAARPWPASRPLWLLSTPEPLSEVDGRPRRGGPLRLCGGPERIETGWWAGEVTRDYYRATDVHGVRMWVYRERRPPHRWFLHGVSG